jgi:DNA-binding NarL/FixJ family response regulator
MANVLVAADSPMVRTELKRFLNSDPSLKHVHDVACGEPLIDALWDENWDLLILGLTPPDRNSLDVLFHSTTKYQLPVLVAGCMPDMRYARWVLRSGAAGYFLNDAGHAELLHAVHKVLSGRFYMSLPMAQLVIASVIANGRTKWKTKPLRKETHRAKAA